MVVRILEAHTKNNNFLFFFKNNNFPDLLAAVQISIQCLQRQVFTRQDQKLKGGQLYRTNHSTSIFSKRMSEQFFVLIAC